MRSTQSATGTLSATDVSIRNAQLLRVNTQTLSHCETLMDGIVVEKRNVNLSEVMTLGW
jgi:hypothetical protein